MKKAGWMVVFLFVAAIAGTAWGAQAKNLDELLAERSANVWVDGQVLGDLVLGAKARLTFIYVDPALAVAARNDPGAPEWLTWHSRHIGEKDLKGKALFLLRIETFTPWELVPGNITVGNYTVSPEDVLSLREYSLAGELPSGFKGTMPFSVPKSFLKSGSRITLGYGEDSAEWKVLGK